MHARLSVVCRVRSAVAFTLKGDYTSIHECICLPCHHLRELSVEPFFFGSVSLHTLIFVLELVFYGLSISSCRIRFDKLNTLYIAEAKALQ